MDKKYKHMTKEQAKAYTEAWGQPMDDKEKAQREKNKKRLEQIKAKSKR